MLGLCLSMGFRLSDNQARYFKINFENPAFSMRLFAALKPLIKRRVILTQTCKNGITLIELIGLPLNDIWQVDRLRNERQP